MSDTHKIELTIDALRQVTRMCNRSLELSQSYMPDREMVDALEHTIIILRNLIGLGGYITGPPTDSDETMILNGNNEYLQYGVVIHDTKLPSIAAGQTNTEDWPHIYEYGIHS